MSGRILTIPRAPREYNPGKLAARDSRIEKAVNSLARQLGVLEQQNRGFRLQLTQREADVKSSTLTPVGEVIWSEFESGGITYARGKLFFVQGWSRIENIQYRNASTTDGGNIDESEPWLDWDAGGSAMSWVADTNYPGGGYYLYQKALPLIKKTTKNENWQVQIQALDASGAVWINKSQNFDPDKDPEIDNVKLFVGNWNESAGTWEVFVTGNADQDTQSVAFGVQQTAYNEDALLLDADFGTATVNLATSDKSFDAVSLGTFSPSTESTQQTVYMIGRAYDEINKGGNAQNYPFIRDQIDIPFDPFDPDIIDAGEIVGSKLAASAQRASIQVVGRHKASFEHEIIQYRGTITYADETSYDLAGNPATWQDLDPVTDDVLYYIFFDPDTWAGEGSGTPATQLQLTQDETIAGAVSQTSRRLQVGVMRTTGATPERAFFVFNGDQPALSAPFIYAAKLAALSADMGDLTAGSIVITTGANKIWLNDSDDGALNIGGLVKGSAPFRVAADGSVTITGAGSSVGWSTVTDDDGNKPDDNATEGATWSINITNQPSDSAILNANQVWSDITGAGLPDDNATVGATWSGNLTGKPEGADKLTSDASPTLGLNLTNTYLGYYNAGWQTYMDASGRFYLGGVSGKLQWDGANLTIDGGGTFTGALSAATGDFAGSLTAATGSFTGNLTGASMSLTGKLSVGSFTIGEDVNGAGWDGIYINATNKWRDTGNEFQVGTATDYMEWDGTELTIYAGGLPIFNSNDGTYGSFNSAQLKNLSVSGTLTMGGSGTITDSGANYSITDGGIDISAGSISLSKDAAGGGYSYLTDIDGAGVVVSLSGWTLLTQVTTITGGDVKAGTLTLTDTGGLTGSINYLGLSGGFRIGTDVIWHAGNDGASSGLDADLLDGQHGSYYQVASDALTDLTNVGVVDAADKFLVSTAAGAWGYETTSQVRSTLGLVIGTNVQAYDADLTTLAGLAKTNGNFIVGNGSAWVAESGSTARASIGIGAHLEDLNALSAVTSNEKIMMSSGSGTWAYEDACYVDATALNGSNRGPKFVGSNIYGSGGTPATVSFSGWLYVRVSGNVYRVALYANGS